MKSNGALARGNGWSLLYEKMPPLPVPLLHKCVEERGMRRGKLVLMLKARIGWAKFLPGELRGAGEVPSFRGGR